MTVSELNPVQNDVQQVLFQSKQKVLSNHLNTVSKF